MVPYSNCSELPVNKKTDNKDSKKTYISTYISNILLYIIFSLFYSGIGRGLTWLLSEQFNNMSSSAERSSMNWLTDIGT